MKTTTPIIISISALFVSALLLFSQVRSSFAEMTPDYEIAVSKGNAKIDSKKYDEATAIFRELLRSYPDDPGAMLMLGIALSRKGELKEAEAALLDVAGRQYDLPRTHYELGVIYYKLGDYSKSKEYFKSAEQKSSDLLLDSSASGFMGSIEQRQQTKRYSLQATVGLQYDSNVSLRPSEDDPVINVSASKGADSSMVVFLRGSMLLTDAPIRTEAFYSIYQSLHTHAADFNIHNHELGLKAEFSPAQDIAFEARYLLNYTLLGGDRYSAVHTVSPAVRLSFINRMPLRLIYNYERKSFFDHELVENNNDRSGNYHAIGFEQKISATNNLFFTLAYYYDDNNTHDEVFSYTGNKIAASVDYNYQSKWSVGANFEYHNKNYGTLILVSPPLVQNREDITRTFNFYFVRPITPVLSVSLNQSFIINSSSVSFYSYDRAITGIFLTARF
jgi:tetratricopeptide (TPR) repeat protein